MRDSRRLIDDKLELAIRHLTGWLKLWHGSYMYIKLILDFIYTQDGSYVRLPTMSKRDKNDNRQD